MKFAREIGDLLLTGTGWWRHAASYCIGDGHYEAIPSRDGKSLYLLRCWLSQPKRDEHGRLESGNSMLLHAFAQPDDDGALHNHPWGFVTHILQGGYTELRRREMSFSDIVMPHTDRRIMRAGDVAERDLADWHMITELHGPTWTLVHTGTRCMDWGFLVDEKMVPWQTFLKDKYHD